MRFTSHAIAAAALVVLAGGGCHAVPHGTTSGAASPPSAEQSDLAAMEKARADSARLPYTAADIHFMSGMIVNNALHVYPSAWFVRTSYTCDEMVR